MDALTETIANALKADGVGDDATCAFLAISAVANYRCREMSDAAIAKRMAVSLPKPV